MKNIFYRFTLVLFLLLIMKGITIAEYIINVTDDLELVGKYEQCYGLVNIAVEGNAGPYNIKIYRSDYPMQTKHMRSFLKAHYSANYVWIFETLTENLDGHVQERN